MFAPSRLFIYYNERVIENSVDEDAGAMIRDGIKSVAKEGAPHETLWPYDISKFRNKPTPAAYKDASKHRAILYQRLDQTLQQLKGCLASGYPFVFGFSVYESFESDAVAKTGKMPMPKPKEKQLGGHAVLAVGHDTASKRFLVRNSWGPDWGWAVTSPCPRPISSTAASRTICGRSSRFDDEPEPEPPRVARFASPGAGVAHAQLRRAGTSRPKHDRPVASGTGALGAGRRELGRDAGQMADELIDDPLIPRSGVLRERNDDLLFRRHLNGLLRVVGRERFHPGDVTSATRPGAR